MSTIFELFGYRLDDQSPEAKFSRENALCPFMNKLCDGGGNRHLSNIDLSNKPELKTYFNELEVVPSGVCSLQLQSEQKPWIVCPRRLMYLGNDLPQKETLQQASIDKLLALGDFPKESRLGVWSELRVAHKHESKSFQYTFDYVLMELKSVSQTQLEKAVGTTWSKLRRRLERAGYTLAVRNGLEFVEHFPVGVPLIVEIMTSSTSGGNKKKRTAIPMAVEDAILRNEHAGPGINYRQVWARMVSQLIVKSEVGIAWGGRTVWVLQNKLADYISSSTALNLQSFLSKHPSEVNILSFDYDDNFERGQGIVEISKSELFSGRIGDRLPEKPRFQDMIHAPVLPAKEVLMKSLIGRSPRAIISQS